MQENTWPRLRESHARQGASYSTQPTYYPAYLYNSSIMETLGGNNWIDKKEYAIQQGTPMSYNYYRTSKNVKKITSALARVILF